MDLLPSPSTDANALRGVLLEHLTAGLICCVIAGCGSLYPENRPWSEGWRLARIIEIDRKPDFSQQPSRDCRSHFADPDKTELHFALVEHRIARNRGQWIVLLDPNDSFREGDYVYVNLNDCSKPAERERPR